MRFREIYEIWRGDNSLSLALGESFEMLDKTQRMFRESVRNLRDDETPEMGLNIYEEDRIINAYQIDARRKVLRYLAVTGTVDLIPGLVLTSIVIDIERIGDYTKNITELASAHRGKLHCGRFESAVREVELTVERLFREIRTILESSDQQTARTLIEDCRGLRKDADRIINELILQEDESLRHGRTAAIALYVRYLKRVGAHLLNILSTVVNPFERIGFREWNRRS